MQWRKLGLVYGPDGTSAWACNSALTPTPILLHDTVIRVFAGFRDCRGVSRIGYVDVSPREPTRVLRVSDRPVLDIGRPGSFDDNGVILGDLVRDGQGWRMYYVGFTKPPGIKFRAFSGAAYSCDGEAFERLSEEPVLGASQEGAFIRTIHTVMRERGKWKAWYAAGSGWTMIDRNPYPQYQIHYQESSDGLNFVEAGSVCLARTDYEYRIGRPRVYKRADHGYFMIFTVGTTDRTYLPGFAESRDGLDWERDDTKLNLQLSPSGWDSETLCYPALIEAHGRIFAFYNGNSMGIDGFGVAELLEG